MSKPLCFQESLVAWTDDRDHLYRNYAPQNWNNDPATRGGANTSATGVNAQVVNINQNQHFMVWMRPAAQPTVRKLWGVIRQQLPRGARAPAASRGCRERGSRLLHPLQ